MKLRANILAEMNAFLQKRHDEDEALKIDIDNITDQLNKYVLGYKLVTMT